jgi:UDP-GlcNAc3NAcA epimerase
MPEMLKIANIVGARPQFIKYCPVMRAIASHNQDATPKIRDILIHTGQHYDYLMSKVFFEEFGIREPDFHLEVGSGSHAQQTGQIMTRVEAVLEKEKPDLILVYGDTNSTLGGALAAAKMHVPVGHVEAGLRSFNKYMPEEINRLLTDQISTILFCPSRTAIDNLVREGLGSPLFEGELIPLETSWMNFGQLTERNKN